ncbi:SEC10/PgrA surface exclusion domain-containing protein [Streptococcus pacificus]|uniref:SEC10/PgrA surface exclusion domain-containing protein n=1 Tax=Streptococcus pacificus TaxID=2740577 RepID=A0ABS0ZJY4_9STRE|nr:SEC10/PgrA surface exclusion domain-containing protein [Streptococcus pacificus]MBJ8326303.1 SEC10/PgrA surface exclusion domain-containing protein [Streptococcus pacificus]
MNKKTKFTIAAVTIAAASIGQTVNADTDEVVKTMEQPAIADNTKMKEVTKKEVDSAKNELDTASNNVNKQETIVADLETKIIDKQTKIETLSKQANNIVSDTQDATPENIEVTKQEVEKAEKNIKKAKYNILLAENVDNEAKNIYDAQKLNISKVQTELDNKKKSESALQSELDIVTAELSEKENTLPSTTKAEADVKDKEKAVETAKADLETKTQDDLNLKNKIEDAQNKVDTAKQTLISLEHALNDALSDKEDADNNVLTKERELTDVKSGEAATETYSSKIKISTQWANTFKELMNAKGTRRRELMNQLKDMTQDEMANNTFSGSDMTAEKYDVNELPTEIKNELAFYFADLLDSIKKQLGIETPTIVNIDLMSFADNIAQEYREDKWNLGEGHNKEGIGRAAERRGLLNDDNYYENLYSETSPKSEYTKDELYHMTFKAMNLLFMGDADSSYSHALSLAQEKTFGLSISSYDTNFPELANMKVTNLHIVDNKYPMTMPIEDLYESLYGLTSELNLTKPEKDTSYQDAINKAQSEYDKAVEYQTQALIKLNSVRSAYDTAKTESETTEKTLNQLLSQSSGLGEALEKLEKAKATLVDAKESLATIEQQIEAHQAKIESLKAKKSELETNLAIAKDEISKTQNQLNNEITTYDTAKATLLASETKLNEAKEMLEEALKNLENSKVKYERLINEKQAYTQKLAELESTKLEYVETISEYNEAKTELNNLKSVQGEAKTKYDHLYAIYHVKQSQNTTVKQIVENKSEATKKTFSRVEKNKQTNKILPSTSSTSNTLLSLLGFIGLFGAGTLKRKQEK